MKSGFIKFRALPSATLLGLAIAVTGCNKKEETESSASLYAQIHLLNGSDLPGFLKIDTGCANLTVRFKIGIF